MAQNKWIVRTATGEFLVGGFYEPTPPSLGLNPDGSVIVDPAYAVVALPVDLMPNPRAQKWNGSAVVAKTPAEIASYDAAQTDAMADLTSRHKDVLATCALVVRARGIAAWNAMSTQQKIDAARAEATVWKTLRIFAENNL